MSETCCECKTTGQHRMGCETGTLNELRVEIINYRSALRAIIDYHGECQDEDYETGETCGGCPWCIATKALGREK